MGTKKQLHALNFALSFLKEKKPYFYWIFENTKE